MHASTGDLLAHREREAEAAEHRRQAGVIEAQRKLDEARAEWEARQRDCADLSRAAAAAGQRLSAVAPCRRRRPACRRPRPAARGGRPASRFQPDHRLGDRRRGLRVEAPEGQGRR